MSPFASRLAVLVAVTLATGIAQATSVTFYKDFDGGLQHFNELVSAAGATAVHDQWAGPLTGITANRAAGYTVRRTGTGPLALTGYPSQYYVLEGSVPNRSTSGYTVRIDPGLNAGGALNINSGLTLSFSEGVNAIAFELGDWGTCCQPSNLYIRFDDETPILIGSSMSLGDTSTLLTNGGAGVFIAALDDSRLFSKVQIWGDAIGEVLHVGGTVHFARLAEGSLTVVPVPGAAWLLGSGLVGLVGLGRRHAAARM